MNDDSKIIRVFSGTEIQVNLLKEELINIGIVGLIKNENKSGLAAGFFGSGPSAIDFYIPEEDQAKAEAIILEFIERNK